MQGSYEPKVVSPQQCCQTRLKVLEPNQGYHGMRRRMLIRSNLVSGGYLFPGGRYPQKTCFSHICRASPGGARDQPMVSADAQSNSATTSGG